MTPARPSERAPAPSAALRLARLRLKVALALSLLLFGVGRGLDLQHHLTVESLRGACLQTTSEAFF
jgi:hypothetical protein